MQNLHEITIDLKHKWTYRDIEVVRGDKTAPVFAITLTDDGIPFSPPADAVISLAIARPDKAVVTLPGILSGQKIIFELSDTALAIPGRALSEVVMVTDEQRLTSMNIEFYIRPSVIYDGALVPQATVEELQAVLTDLQVAIAAGNLDNYALKTDVTATLAPYALAADIKQADWGQTQSTEPDFIKNKPTLGTAALKDTGAVEGTIPLLGAGGVLAGAVIPAEYPTIETGTWTPTVSSETGTPPEETNANRQGVYTRVGNLVMVQFLYQATLANGTGAAILGGLPFTPTKVATGGALMVYQPDPFATHLVNAGNLQKIRFYKNGAVVSLAGFSGTVNIRGSFSYLI